MTDKNDAYANTPLLIRLKLRLRISLTKNDCFNLYDVSTAFLHTKLKNKVYLP